MKKPTEHDNSEVVDYLQHYTKLKHAIEDYPFLEDIVFGVCNLDMGGNTRPLNTGQFFTLLANQRVISVANIMEAHWCQKRQAQNICQALRIASREFIKRIKRMPAKVLYNPNNWVWQNKVDTKPKEELK